MRTTTLLCAAALLGMSCAFGVFAQSQPPLPAVSGQPEQQGNGDNPDSVKKSEPENSVPGDAPAAMPGDKPPLLPVPPQGFNPMMPAPDAQGGSVDNFQQLSMANILMAELRGYAVQLTLFTRWLALVAAGGGLLFLAQILYMRGQAVQARKAADAAMESADLAQQQLDAVKENSHHSLRAYVFTNGAKGELPADKSGKYVVRVEVRNFGTTPAYGVNGWMTVFTGDMAQEKAINLLPHDSQKVETILPPGGVCFYYARTHDPVTHEIKAIAAGTRAIYAYGEIRYRDVFGIERYARFRIKCSGERNLTSGSFDHCIGGNEAN